MKEAAAVAIGRVIGYSHLEWLHDVHEGASAARSGLGAPGRRWWVTGVAGCADPLTSGRTHSGVV